MPLVTANQYDLVPQFSNIGKGAALGMQMGSQFRANRLENEKLNESKAKEWRIKEATPDAVEGDPAALAEIAKDDPKRALDLQKIFQGQSDAEVAEGLRENKVLTQAALDAQSLPPEKRRPYLMQKQQEWKAAGRDTSNIDRALAGDDAAMNQAIELQARQGLEIDDQAKALFPDSNKTRSLDIQQQTLEQRQTEQAYKEEQDAIKAEQLSPTVQKILDASQTNAVEAGNRSRSLSVLADDVEKLDIGGGVKSSTSEKLKELLGGQDEVSELRRRFRAVRASQSVQNLPPGPASDKDIALALSGFPSETANGAQIASFLRGAAKLEGINAAFETFKSDLISKSKSTKGMLTKWNEKVDSEVLGRKVRYSELFITAQEEGVTVEELKQQLGIQ